MGITDWPALIVFIVVNCVAASSGAIFQPGSWYKQIEKPSWTPPNWLFPPAWTLLFAVNAFAGYLVWISAAPGEATIPMIVYGVSLSLNAGWSAFFFGLRRPDLAFGELSFLWLSILAQIVVFYPVRADAALLSLPYLAWVTFAGALNLSIWRRNAPIAQSAT